MNKTKLKAYAPQARKDFIAAVTARANLLGLSEKSGNLEVAVGERKGDIAIIAGREWPAKVYSQREDLIKRMTNEGFDQTVEAIAYTWFNRLAALRYMEIHDYLDHGHRALSNREGGMPEILNHATELDLPGLNKTKAIELKLAGNKDNDLYKLILVAQCNALSSAMPFLFERIDDETELLLPDNLLLTDSVITKLVADIPEEDWQEVEIIGWLYQFYISDEKARVDAKLKKSGEVVLNWEIPAKTQLFTPNWIVQYLVQNSVGRLWMMANPSSSIHIQWPYYIKPAEQTPAVNAQLEQLINTRIAEDGTTLNPESITVLDPACGSGHILVEAYETLKQIYLERGYQPRTIPRLILEKNLYGIDIDNRAAQLAGFALLMKARADDRRILQESPKLNVISLHESKGLNADQLAQSLNKFGVNRNNVVDLIETFQHAKTFGSLIQIPAKLASALSALSEQCQQAHITGDLFAQGAAQSLLPLITQSTLLAKQYDAVIANPPYLGNGMDSLLKSFAKAKFPDSKSDLFAMFIERGFNWCKSTGFNSMVTMQSWMFLSSYETMREKLLNNRTLSCMVHMGNGVMGIAFGTAATIMQSKHVNSYEGSFTYCDNDDLTEANIPKEFPVKNERLKNSKPDDFKKIPGSPVAYWVSSSIIKAFESNKISDLAETRLGMATANNNKFLRLWHEINIQKTFFSAKSRSEAIASKRRWFPYQKGGEFRKWYGNLEYLVNWENDGFEIQNFTDLSSGKVRSHNYNLDYIFVEGITWNALSSSSTSARLSKHSLFDNAGSSLFEKSLGENLAILSLINSCVIDNLIKAISPTLNYQPGDISKLPIAYTSKEKSVFIDNSAIAIQIAKSDWDDYETSWDFTDNPLIRTKRSTLSQSFETWKSQNLGAVAEMKRLEEENNRLFIEAYGLQDELTPDVPDDKITLTRADREKDSQRFVSFAIGCMMGRYSLDAPGLIYAHAGNEGFDASQYTTFLADADGIVPITDLLWFEDHAANRVQEFLQAVWGKAALDENMAWLAESLGGKESETPIETIRRYLYNSFYKDHLQTYKKRPIYWHFSSGKQGAFQALVYLHRYNEGTLARMRSEYVVPLTGKMLSRIAMLEKDSASATSTASRTKINKEIEALRKQHIELLAYDEKLRHYADMRIQLDLDDGVKVNYGKFGDLLAEVKAITGGSDE